jgi:hypothetical protein
MDQIGEKVIISTQVPARTRAELVHLANENERSLSGEMRRAFDLYLRVNEVPAGTRPESNQSKEN